MDIDSDDDPFSLEELIEIEAAIIAESRHPTPDMRGQKGRVGGGSGGGGGGGGGPSSSIGRELAAGSKEQSTRKAANMLPSGNAPEATAALAPAPSAAVGQASSSVHEKNDGKKRTIGEDLHDPGVVQGMGNSLARKRAKAGIVVIFDQMVRETTHRWNPPAFFEQCSDEVLATKQLMERFVGYLTDPRDGYKIREKVGTDDQGNDIFAMRNVMGSTMINYMQDLMQCIKERLTRNGNQKWQAFLMCTVQVRRLRGVFCFLRVSWQRLQVSQSDLERLRGVLLSVGVP